MILFVGDTPSTKMKPGAPAFQGADCEKRSISWIETLAKNDSYYVINQSDPVFWIYVGFALITPTKIIALGNNASKALGKYSHFKMPHPSGRNRQLNNKAFINKKLKECKKWLKSTP